MTKFPSIRTLLIVLILAIVLTIWMLLQIATVTLWDPPEETGMEFYYQVYPLRWRMMLITFGAAFVTMCLATILLIVKLLTARKRGPEG